MKQLKNAILTLILVVGCIGLGEAQSGINDYKYIIVPKKYDFLKIEDQYQLNSLTAFLFKKHGFSVLMEGDSYPDDLEKGICLALNSNVIENNGLFKTKVQIELKNCKNQIVFTSKLGESREKKFKVAYNLALRDAFESVEIINYSYKPNTNAISQVVAYNNETEDPVEVEKLKAEIEELKKVKNEAESEPKKRTEILEETLIEESIKEEPLKEGTTNLLYAQPKGKGFQIVDSTPKVIMVLLETALENTFVVKNGNAIVYKQDGFWYISKNDGKSISIEQLNIKF